ncbi:MAG: phosphotransferase [Alphaproteobacteria bacterium]|nr:phosphotransferase [Alphaproteobacteria bacterium]
MSKQAAKTPAKGASQANPEAEMALVLRRLGLAGPDEVPRLTRLAGGVSSDIWRADLHDGPVCIKRALAQLRVPQIWKAPVERGRYEWEWIRFANAVAPGAAPRALAFDEEAMLVVMAWLPPEDNPLWKAELHAGRADPEFAGSVGRTLAMIHGASAGRQDIAERFPADEIFYAIRLEPYLIATARVHDDLAPRLQALAATTATTKRALVHGDVSPKNIMVGKNGPVFLDAETAWYGDPAFDLAFCLNHMLLKCLWTPASTNAFLACFDALTGRYLEGVDWEPRAELEARAAHLLPALFLARVDGKSPAEYITADADRERVRRTARPLIAEPVENLASIRARWSAELGA